MYLKAAFFSFILVNISLPFVIRGLIKLGIVDKPDNERKIHNEPIPRLGGAILYVVILGLLFAFGYKIDATPYYLLSGSFVVFMLGVVDDIKGVTWRYKFAVQSIAAVLLILQLCAYDCTKFNIAGLNLSDFIGLGILFIFILGAVNSFNLMDGIDGLVSGYTLLISSFCFLLIYDGSLNFNSILAITISGAVLGFLSYNSNPAKIFLGDSGSLTLGYFSVYLIFSSINYKSGNIDLLFAAIVIALPMIDTLRLIFFRLLNKKSPFLPDQNHLHHILLKNNVRHKVAVFIILFIGGAGVFIGSIYYYYSVFAGLTMFALYLIILFSIEKIITKELVNIRSEVENTILSKAPSYIIDIFRKLILPIMTVVVFIYLFHLSLKNNLQYGNDFSLFMAVTVFMIIYSFVSIFKKSLFRPEIFIFINVLLFFVLINYNSINAQPGIQIIYKITDLNNALLILLVPSLLFSIIFSERIFNKKDIVIMNGFDLIIASFVFTLYVIIHLFNYKNGLSSVANILINSFIFYLFYKVAISRFLKYQIFFYLTSFLLVFIVLFRVAFI